MKTAILAATNEEFEILSSLEWNRSTVVRQMGIGLTNAAIATYDTIHKHNPEVILVAGLAGAVDPKLVIGDIILAHGIFQHDSFRSTDNGDPFYIKPGISSLRKDEHLDPTLKCDAELNNKIRALLASKFRILEGTIASGSEFMCSTRRKLDLHKTQYNILALDMESAGVVQVATQFNVPVSCLRVISDIVHTKSEETILDNYIQNLEISTVKLKNAVGCLLSVF